MIRDVQFSKRMDLEEALTFSDGAGGHTVTWNKIGSVWVDIKSGTLRNDAVDGVKLTTGTHRILFRTSSSQIWPRIGQRLRSGQTVYVIDGVERPLGNGQLVTCFTTQGVA